MSITPSGIISKEKSIAATGGELIVVRETDGVVPWWFDSFNVLFEFLVDAEYDLGKEWRDGIIFILESHAEDEDDDAVEEEEEVNEDVVESQNWLKLLDILVYSWFFFLLLLLLVMILFVVSILVEIWDNDCESLDVACEAHDDTSKLFWSWTECIIVGDVNDVKESSDIESIARFFWGLIISLLQSYTYHKKRKEKKRT